VAGFANIQQHFLTQCLYTLAEILEVRKIIVQAGLDVPWNIYQGVKGLASRPTCELLENALPSVHRPL
jgi:hypothetical protein